MTSTKQQLQLTEVGYVNHLGHHVELGAIASNSPKRPRPKETAKFMGFIVEGHPPGAMEAAQAIVDREIARWAALTNEQRSKEREPKPFDPEQWRAKTKKKRVRARPYEVHEAAMLCVSLATKEGWLDVEARADERR